ncbi:MAG: hypothetical protein ABSA11_11320 [Candidatus Bathyarchaeia archaeon]
MLRLGFWRACAFMLMLVSVGSSVGFASAQTNSSNPVGVTTSLFMNQNTILIFVIELLLGLGLGYFSVKIVKYILALILIFMLGVVLNIWNSPALGVNIQQQLSSLGLEWGKVYPVLLSIVYMLGLTTILPITVGFFIGVVIAIVR